MTIAPWNTVEHTEAQARADIPTTSRIRGDLSYVHEARRDALAESQRLRDEARSQHGAQPAAMHDAIAVPVTCRGCGARWRVVNDTAARRRPHRKLVIACTRCGIEWIVSVDVARVGRVGGRGRKFMRAAS